MDKDEMRWIMTLLPIVTGMLLYDNLDTMTGLLVMSVAFVLSRALYDRT